VPLAILALGMAVGPLCAVGQAQQTTSSSSGNQSWWDSTCSGVKQGFDNLCHPFTPAKPSIPAPKPEDDAVSLRSKGKAGAELYVAVAQLYEQSNRMAEAEQQYLLALKEKPDDLAAILGYAHLQEQVGKPNEAILLYQRAVKAYPRQASVHNNLGLCYARQNRLGEAVAAIGRAIQFDPKNLLYRNNIATLLVDEGRVDEAFAHLREVHGNAAAHYNMGYLLNKKGQAQPAMQHFMLALQADPSMEAARRWVQYLQRTTAQARLASNPIATGVRVTSQPTMPQEDELARPVEPTPRRLPPTMLRPPPSDNSELPGISYGSSAPPTAPLPPTLLNPSLRPLPKVD
jgi:tetratricopeptide (TPR) repeat protein